MNYYKNQKIIKKWTKLLFLYLHYIFSHIFFYSLYEEIKNDYKMNRLIEVIEEYNDIIFKEEKKKWLKVISVYQDVERVQHW